MSNPCIRCGKDRIEGKTWKSNAGSSIITHTQTLCPDSECQKVIDDAIAEKRAKNDLLIKQKAESKLARAKIAAVN